MAAFQPTLAPPGRLVRLGVVLDARTQGGQIAEVARMCDRAGIGVVWVDDSVPSGLPPPPLEAWTTLATLAPVTTRARLGAMLAAGRRPAPLLAAMATTLTALAGDRVEVSLLGVEARSEVDDLVAGLDPSGPRPRVAVEAGDPERLDRERLAWLVGVADDVLLTMPDVDRVAEAARELRAACAITGRDPAGLGVAARLPVSVGRTVAEAAARWDAEPAFGALGPPGQAGVFGTLEQCHDRVLALAHAGVTDLRCVLPNAPDIHDVIAQVTAVSVGTVAKLAPGAPRSPAPPPPAGWGGRPRFPRPEGS
jgi:alkanesulfonate monooxygenase SsuD/methylene tetrahydromethanopterin reductase-like flavin-dependent oxidoreductase (luciferase family)